MYRSDEQQVQHNLLVRETYDTNSHFGSGSSDRADVECWACGLFW